MDLPSALAAALEGLLDGKARAGLAARAEALSAAYRAGGTSAGVGAADALAYAAARMPATFAATRAALAQAAAALPDFRPESLLDMGCGPGTASWAALDAWPGIGALTLVDRNPALLALARQLAAGPLAAAEVRAGDIAAPPGPADLVIASYVLAELPEGRAAETALGLWAAARQMLVLVEPGTPPGFARIRAARAALVAAGAHVAAPCTHDGDCPLQGPDWCHFSQRLSRRRAHMQLKGAQVPFEDERYAYVAVSRAAVSRTGARILASPRKVGAGLAFRLCDGKGAREETVARRDKAAFAAARRLSWGDLFQGS
jgi:ribosomal protein RSM22 (predicted rRNA methylase)